MIMRGNTYSAPRSMRKYRAAAKVAAVSGFMLVLAGCSGIGLGDFARTTQQSAPAARAIKASLTINDSVDPSDWETVRRVIARIPVENAGRFDWANPDTGSTGTITVLALSAGGTSATCRAFATTISDARGIRRYRGEACRRNDGRWQLFGVTADDATLL